jgi:hypothetical protein
MGLHKHRGQKWTRYFMMKLKWLASRRQIQKSTR